MKEILFSGKITATATHEIKNVLAIIRESSGLMADFLGMIDDDSFKYRDRFLKILSNIEDQVVRGDEVSTLLNRFAHAPDHESATENVLELLEQIVALSQRLARAKQVTFLIQPSPHIILLTCKPVTTRMLVFQAMETLMNHVQPGENITIRAEVEEDKKVLIEFCPQSEAVNRDWSAKASSPDVLDELESTAASINAKVLFHPESGVLGLELSNLDVSY